MMPGKINAGVSCLLRIIFVIKGRLQQFDAGFGTQIRAADANDYQRGTFLANLLGSMQNILHHIGVHTLGPVHPTGIGILFVHQLVMNFGYFWLILRPVISSRLHPVI